MYNKKKLPKYQDNLRRPNYRTMSVDDIYNSGALNRGTGTIPNKTLPQNNNQVIGGTNTPMYENIIPLTQNQIDNTPGYIDTTKQSSVNDRFPQKQPFFPNMYQAPHSANEYMFNAGALGATARGIKQGDIDARKGIGALAGVGAGLSVLGGIASGAKSALQGAAAQNSFTQAEQERQRNLRRYQTQNFVDEQRQYSQNANETDNNVRGYLNGGMFKDNPFSMQEGGAIESVISNDITAEPTNPNTNVEVEKGEVVIDPNTNDVRLVQGQTHQQTDEYKGQEYSGVPTEFKGGEMVISNNGKVDKKTAKDFGVPKAKTYAELVTKHPIQKEIDKINEKIAEWTKKSEKYLDETEDQAKATTNSRNLEFISGKINDLEQELSPLKEEILGISMSVYEMQEQAKANGTYEGIKPPIEEQEQMQDGGQMEAIVQEVASMLQQGANPQEVLAQLVEAGIPQQEAEQLVMMVMEQMQGQPQMQGQMMQNGGSRDMDMYKLKQAYIDKGYTPDQADTLVKDYYIRKNNPYQGELIHNDIRTVEQNSKLNSYNNISEEQLTKYYPQLLDKKQEGGQQSDKYGNPISSRIIKSKNDRSYYDSRTNSIVLGKDYDSMSEKQKKDLLTHENFHSFQFKNDMSSYLPVGGGAPITKPPMVSSDENYYKYHNRKKIEADKDVQNFRDNNKSFNFVPKKLIFDKAVSNAQYDNPYSFEGQATFYEKTGDVFPFQDGGKKLPKYQDNNNPFLVINKEDVGISNRNPKGMKSLKDFSKEIDSLDSISKPLSNIEGYEKPKYQKNWGRYWQSTSGTSAPKGGGYYYVTPNKDVITPEEYQMMNKSLRSNMVFQEGGQQDPTELLMAFAQLTGMGEQEFEQLVAELQNLPPEQMEQALMEIEQQVMQSQQPQQEMFAQNPFSQGQAQMQEGGKVLPKYQDSNPFIYGTTPNDEFGSTQRGQSAIGEFLDSWASEPDYSYTPLGKEMKNRLASFLEEWGFDKKDVEKARNSKSRTELNALAGKLQEKVIEKQPEIAQHYGLNVAPTRKGLQWLADNKVIDTKEYPSLFKDGKAVIGTKSSNSVDFNKLNKEISGLDDKKKSEYAKVNYNDNEWFFRGVEARTIEFDNEEEYNKFLKNQEENKVGNSKYYQTTKQGAYIRPILLKEKEFNTKEEMDAWIEKKGNPSMYDAFFDSDDENIFLRPKYKGQPEEEKVIEEEEKRTFDPGDWSPQSRRGASGIPLLDYRPDIISGVRTPAMLRTERQELSPVKISPENQIRENQRNTALFGEIVGQNVGVPDNFSRQIADANQQAFSQANQYNAQQVAETDRLNTQLAMQNEARNQQYMDTYQTRALQGEENTLAQINQMRREARDWRIGQNRDQMSLAAVQATTPDMNFNPLTGNYDVEYVGQRTLNAPENIVQAQAMYGNKKKEEKEQEGDKPIKRKFKFKPKKK